MNYKPFTLDELLALDAAYPELGRLKEAAAVTAATSTLDQTPRCRGCERLLRRGEHGYCFGCKQSGQDFR